MNSHPHSFSKETPLNKKEALTRSQIIAFAAGVPLRINPFHRSAESTMITSSTQVGMFSFNFLVSLQLIRPSNPSITKIKILDPLEHSAYPFCLRLGL